MLFTKFKGMLIETRYQILNNTVHIDTIYQSNLMFFRSRKVSRLVKQKNLIGGYKSKKDRGKDIKNTFTSITFATILCSCLQ